MISDWGGRTKILYLKRKLDQSLKETEAVYNEMKELTENKDILFNLGWKEDVNSCVEEYMNSRIDESNCSVSANSVSSWIQWCEKEHLQLEKWDTTWEHFRLS